MANEKNIRIGDVLLQAGYINQEELDEALEYQKNNKGIRLGEALIKLGFITEHQQLEALSARLGQRYVKIDRIMVQTEAVAMIPVQLAKKYHMLAVQYQDNNLTIVLNDPLDYYGIEDIRQTTGMNLEIWLTELLPLNQAIEYYYSEIEAKRPPAQQMRWQENVSRHLRLMLMREILMHRLLSFLTTCLHAHLA